MCPDKMTDESVASSIESSGSYDDAIVAIAICDNSASDIDDHDDDGAFDDIITDISSNIDDADIDHEETWLRRCAGDLPDGIVSNPSSFANLPQEVQMKLLLNLREREKAALLENLRHNCSVVESLKAQLCESESRRLELEESMDTEHIEVEEMRREFEEMKEVHKCRIEEIERITKEMIVQRERLSTIIDQQQQSNSVQPMNSSSENNSLQCSIDKNMNDRNHRKMVDNQDNNPTFWGGKKTSEIHKSKIEIEIEHKLQTNPQYREEFERFKEFQSYIQAHMSNNQHQPRANTSSNSGSSSIEQTIPLPLSDEYRKLLEFQIMYERILSSATKKNTGSANL